jgi:hypothetical protein
MALQPPPRKPLARNLKNMAQRNSIYPYLGQPLIVLVSSEYILSLNLQSWLGADSNLNDISHLLIQNVILNNAGAWPDSNKKFYRVKSRSR